MIRQRLLPGLAGVLASAGLIASTAETPAQRAPADPVPAGQAIVANGTQAGAPACATCHGANGAGDAAGPYPMLWGQSAAYLAKQLADYASGARPNEIMSPIARALTPEQRGQTAAHYAAQPVGDRPGQGDADANGAAAEPGQQAENRSALLRRGRQLATIGSGADGVQACGNCHGPAGIGLQPGFPALAGQYEPYTIAQLKSWRDGTRKNDPEGVMRAASRHLSDRDMQAVATYYAQLWPWDRVASGNADANLSGAAADPAHSGAQGAGASADPPASGQAR